MAVVEELARAAVSALAGGDVVGALAASRALVEFIHVLSGAGGSWTQQARIAAPARE